MNGQVEWANTMILQGLKPRILTQEARDTIFWLKIGAGKWVAEVPLVL
jgi:hypothetical protein